jgi:hypothetical protein
MSDHIPILEGGRSGIDVFRWNPQARSIDIRWWLRTLAYRQWPRAIGLRRVRLLLPLVAADEDDLECVEVNSA